MNWIFLLVGDLDLVETELLKIKDKTIFILSRTSTWAQRGD